MRHIIFQLRRLFVIQVSSKLTYSKPVEAGLWKARHSRKVDLSTLPPDHKTNVAVIALDGHRLKPRFFDRILSLDKRSSPQKFVATKEIRRQEKRIVDAKTIRRPEKDLSPRLQRFMEKIILTQTVRHSHQPFGTSAFSSPPPSLAAQKLSNLH